MTKLSSRDLWDNESTIHILFAVDDRKNQQLVVNRVFDSTDVKFSPSRNPLKCSAVCTSVLGEESGEGADFKHAAFVPRGVELFNLPTVDVWVIIPWLRLVVFTLVLSLLHLLLSHFAAVEPVDNGDQSFEILRESSSSDGDDRRERQHKFQKEKKQTLVILWREIKSQNQDSWVLVY